MTLRLAINGFGRIGRTILRNLMARADAGLQVTAINDPAPLTTLAHLYEFDSLHGRAQSEITTGDDWMDVGTGPIRFTREQAPEALDWSDIDLVLECSGQFNTRNAALRHLKSGAGRVLLSAPARDAVKTVVFGVNHQIISRDDQLLSCASCTTNCLVPVVHVLDAAFGIEAGMMTTVHCYTNSQSVQDAPHSDLYRARAAALSMIPTTSGAADMLGVVLPHLAGRITSHAIRVPTPDVSCIDLVVTLSRTVSADQVNAEFHAAADGAMRGVLDVTNRKLVSADFRQEPASAVIALDQTHVQSGNLVRIMAWYDNEWGFANRMLDTAQMIAEKTLRN